MSTDMTVHIAVGDIEAVQGKCHIMWWSSHASIYITRDEETTRYIRVPYSP